MATLPFTNIYGKALFQRKSDSSFGKLVIEASKQPMFLLKKVPCMISTPNRYVLCRCSGETIMHLVVCCEYVQSF